MTPEQARALYRKKKYSRPKTLGLGIAISIAKGQAKADLRARRFIERWLAGETHQQIADSEGIARSCVSQSIAYYRKRHPDAYIPQGRWKTEPKE